MAPGEHQNSQSTPKAEARGVKAEEQREGYRGFVISLVIFVDPNNYRHLINLKF